MYQLKSFEKLMSLVCLQRQEISIVILLTSTHFTTPPKIPTASTILQLGSFHCPSKLTILLLNREQEEKWLFERKPFQIQHNIFHPKHVYLYISFQTLGMNVFLVSGMWQSLIDWFSNWSVISSHFICLLTCHLLIRYEVIFYTSIYMCFDNGFCRCGMV